MTLLIDRIINASKWPVAFMALFCLPPAVRSFAYIALIVFEGAARLGPFLIGMFGYLFLWQVLFRRRQTGSFLSTLEHECTHALVAFLTLHGVTGMRVTWNQGGHVRYTRGEGNWLITIAPYFIPTISIIAVLLASFVPPQHETITQGLIGASVGFHLGSSYLETHDTQSDLIKVGYSFCCFFLPTANLLVYALLLAFIWNQGNGFFEVWDRFTSLTSQQIRWTEQFIQSLL